MKTYTIIIKLLSDSLIGSGDGFGAIIDSDVVFDDLGIPFIPAKRIKGCLRDSAHEVCEMFESAQIDFLDLTKDDTKSKECFKIVADTFGRRGQRESTQFFFSNLTINQYKENKRWLNYLSEQYNEIISRDSILSTFTGMRQQTKIEENTGVADDHFLRTIRVLNKDFIFKGDICTQDNCSVKLLVLACNNLRRMGSKRNRGFGEIDCKLYEGSNEIATLKELETTCLD